MKANAQVGINTPIPTSTLDITAKNATGSTTNVDGLLIPRVDRQRAQSMTAVPVSTLIYVNSITTGSQTGTAANIDAAGYYYYDGTLWAKLNPPAPASVNIYNADGTLTGNRTVTQGANTLAFTGTANNAFSVDGNTFSVDASNHRVGIGTITPKNYLHISEPGQTSGITISYVKGQTITATGAGSDASGPGFYFENLSNTATNKVFKMNFTSNGNNDGILNFESVSDGASNSLRKLMSITTKGNVGIGTVVPSAALEINSNTNNISGLKFSRLNSSTPVGTGQAIGVDSSGNVITLATVSNVTAALDASTNSQGGPVTQYFDVYDTSWTTVPGTSQTMTIPDGGKAIFTNFMLGIDYFNAPPGSGAAYYTAKLFVDGAETNVFITTQEPGPGGLQAQFSLSTVKFLSAGNHTVDIRMRRTYNNGSASGAYMRCGVMSMSINSSFIN
ncbi:hypothetical protein DRF57_11555 [Chryseobacterium rhizosphaerae]|uniref:C1q domain-containing protein n=2 Tax=Chryseobacterium rhizosphaerae TaxID=395937 RepID=A0ABX9IKE3_9FLAO|nr:hypothetical protein DRF57_11555 [Chryseobacterium rhizosphaerae]GEN68771.1 hypothetical protein CRH01_33390 [Chryseobacterium rhizosphaerae]